LSDIQIIRSIPYKGADLRFNVVVVIARPEGSTPAQLFSLIQARSLAEQGANQILELISTGRIQPLERLPSEGELAKAMGVGRSSVREAKKLLAARGVLVQRGRQGTFVAEHGSAAARLSTLVDLLGDGTASDLHETRIAIETTAARLAAQRRTRADIARMKRILAALERERDRNLEAACLQAVEFHRALVAASHNEILVAVYELVAELVRSHQVPFYRAIADGRAELRSHSELVRAIEAGNADSAADQMGEHLDDSEHQRHLALERLRR
jgi:GntR family transcriptional repressor for pyruvate dehydrogenase complex